MRPSSSYRWAITIGGLAALLAGDLHYPFSMNYLGIGLATVFFVVFQVNFPIKLLRTETTLVHVFGLGVGMLYNFSFSLCAVAMGFLGER